MTTAVENKLQTFAEREAARTGTWKAALRLDDASVSWGNRWVLMGPLLMLVGAVVPFLTRWLGNSSMTILIFVWVLIPAVGSPSVGDLSDRGGPVLRAVVGVPRRAVLRARYVSFLGFVAAFFVPYFVVLSLLLRQGDEKGVLVSSWVALLGLLGMGLSFVGVFAAFDKVAAVGTSLIPGIVAALAGLGVWTVLFGEDLVVVGCLDRVVLMILAMVLVVVVVGGGSYLWTVKQYAVKDL